MRSFQPQAVQGCLRYHDLPGGGTPLIFLHGLGCASSCDYPSVAAHPALAGRRMLLVDFLGSGFSDRPADFPATVDAHAATIVELASRLEPGAVDIFGHSMGGAVAIMAASRLGRRVRRLVLSEPNLVPGGGAFSLRVAGMSEADYLARGHDDLVRAARSEGLGLWAASMSVSAPWAVHRAAASLVAGSDPSWRDHLLALTIPRTVIFGSESLPDPDVETLPSHGVAVDVVADAGHAMARQNPAGLAEALRRALE